MSDQENGEGETPALRAFCAVVAGDPQIPAESATGWLGREGSNLRMTESKSVALPLGYAPARAYPEPGRHKSGRTIVSSLRRGNGKVTAQRRQTARPELRAF